MKATALSIIAVLALPIETNAEEHQYKYIYLNHTGDNKAGDQAIILDEKTGDMWEYLNQPQIGTMPAARGVMYLGRLRVAEPGQAVMGNFGRK